MIRTLCVMAAFLFSATVGASAQSMAEVAAKEKERRAKRAAPAKSFGDEDLTAAPAGDTKGTFSSTGDASAAKVDDGENDAATEATPRRPAEAEGNRSALIAQYRSRLASADAQLQRAEEDLRFAEENWKFVNSHTNSDYSLDASRRQLERAKANATKARDERSRVLSDARRAGLLPGDLR